MNKTGRVKLHKIYKPLSQPKDTKSTMVVEEQESPPRLL